METTGSKRSFAKIVRYRATSGCLLIVPLSLSDCLARTCLQMSFVQFYFCFVLLERWFLVTQMGLKLAVSQGLPGRAETEMNHTPLLPSLPSLLHSALGPPGPGFPQGCSCT